MPGSTQAVPAAVSTSSSRFTYLLLSTTSAAPTVWPHCDVPAPRGSTGTPASTANASAVTASSAVRGTTTPRGSIW
jgi:hypothetical protein